MTTIDWDSAADSFDEEPDHGLLDPVVRHAWAQRLESWLPGERSDVLDLGCGTGSLALLVTGQGHRVTAVTGRRAWSSRRGPSSPGRAPRCWSGMRPDRRSGSSSST
ncbi:class I SAM-dependent methyltransferase [Streptomyces sp. NBC_01718]